MEHKHQILYGEHRSLRDPIDILPHPEDHFMKKQKVEALFGKARGWKLDLFWRFKWRPPVAENAIDPPKRGIP